MGRAGRPSETWDLSPLGRDAKRREGLSRAGSLIRIIEQGTTGSI